MKIALAAALSLSVLALATPTLAEPPGWYIGLGGGWSNLPDMTGQFSGAGLAAKAQFDNGFVVDGFVGHNFGWFSAEGELAYRRHEAHALSLGGAPLGAVSGNASSLAGMVNGIVNLMPHSQLSPYLGAGAGIARVELDRLTGGGITGISDDTTRFAYQGIAGVSYTVTPQVSLALDYRYFATLDPIFAVTTAAGGGSFKTQYQTHNVLLRLTYHFGRPAPAPAPQPVAAPAPAPVPPPPPAPRIALVFFDFDRATITPEGAKVIEQAAATYKAGGVGRIDLTGYTDLAGTQKYNLALSQRRADAVKAALVKLGVPTDAITETARGKENPRVPTADGVREPQNRRVEIVMP